MNNIFLDNVVFSSAIKINLQNSVLNSFQLSFRDIDQTIKPSFREHIKWNDLLAKALDDSLRSDFFSLVNQYVSLFLDYELSKSNIVSIPPFRGFPKRVYTEGIDTNPLSSYPKKQKEKIIYNYDFEKMELIEGTLEDAFHYWIVEHFHLAEKFYVYESLGGLVSEIKLKINGELIPIINVGFGTSQILPVIFNLLVGNKKHHIFIIDEPEVHLHPSVQSKLSDFFCVMAMIGRNMLIETHSEYIIDKLVFLSLKYENIKEKINMNWVNKSPNGAYVENIEFDDLGYILNRPNGFLTEKEKLVRELSEIRMARL